MSGSRMVTFHDGGGGKGHPLARALMVIGGAIVAAFASGVASSGKLKKIYDGNSEGWRRLALLDDGKKIK